MIAFKAKALLPLLFAVAVALGIIGHIAFDAFSNALDIPLDAARRPAIREQALISLPLNIEVANVQPVRDDIITVFPVIDSLETSTNLIDWEPCSDLYFNLSEPARFFRTRQVD